MTRRQPMPGRYTVDWYTDASYPQIVPDTVAAEDGHTPDNYTFTQAKGSILDHFRTRIDSARAAITEYKKLRVADIKKEYGE